MNNLAIKQDQQLQQSTLSDLLFKYKVESSGQINHDNKTLFVVRIVPELAQEILKHYNPINRKICDGQIELYKKDMENGKFDLADSNILFNNKNNLVNGQHRLLACQESGKPFDAVVGLNWPEDSILRMDRGKARMKKDTLFIKGNAPAAEHVATIESMGKIINQQTVSAFPHPEDIEIEYTKYKSSLEKVDRIIVDHRYTTSTNKAGEPKRKQKATYEPTMNTATTRAIFTLAHFKFPKETESFMEKLFDTTKCTSMQETPSLFRKFLLETRMKGAKRIAPMEIAIRGLWCLKNFIEKKEVGKIKPTKNREKRQELIDFFKKD